MGKKVEPPGRASSRTVTAMDAAVTAMTAQSGFWLHEEVQKGTRLRRGMKPP
jgi:hypothetical protein